MESAEVPHEECLTCVVPKGARDDTCKKFVFKNEDHTLGNALRFVISRYPEVTFCAYTIPHPAENEMVLQIQTTGINAEDVLVRGLQDLREICDITLKKFETARDEFRQQSS
ncbi:unnamed protein product [Allacma fusca]|uniref:DNA-directed RNA polymerase I subunit D n=1 Tax=Allacma fusca TaxID=39272 RepID=A0A8J2J5D1_9HEXA|nr:unnamed protein product [Allacma fusca]